MLPKINGQPVKVVVVGAGASGIASGVMLERDLGLTNYVVYEKNPQLGGTWFSNTYPGCSCDVPSHNYVFTFELNPHYSKLFSTQKEIWQYFARVARKYNVAPKIRYQMEVTSLTWEDDIQMWRVVARSTTDGRIEETLANFVIAGTGGLSRPKIPAEQDLKGVRSFKGPSWHSAEWNHEIDLKDKRVAIIGSGASAVQIVPELANICSQVYTYQRTANWVLPQFNQEYSPLAVNAFKFLPGALWMTRLYHFYLADLIFFNMFKQNTFFQREVRRQCLSYIKHSIKDPELRKKVTPDYEVGCKRILFTDKYLPSLNKPNVHLIADPIDRITETGVRTKTQGLIEVDAIVFATGFLVDEVLAPMQIKGIGGVDLHERWEKSGPEAYLGVVTSGFPNLFISLGPNTALGHNSVLPMIEASIGFGLKLIQQIISRKCASADVKAEAQKQYNVQLQKDLEGSVWAGGCKSWYKEEDGTIRALWSGRIIDYEHSTSSVVAEHFSFASVKSDNVKTMARL